MIYSAIPNRLDQHHRLFALLRMPIPSIPMYLLGFGQALLQKQYMYALQPLQSLWVEVVFAVVGCASDYGDD